MIVYVVEAPGTRRILLQAVTEQPSVLACVHGFPDTHHPATACGRALEEHRRHCMADEITGVVWRLVPGSTDELLTTWSREGGWGDEAGAHPGEGGTAHLSRDGQWTICGTVVGATWTVVPGTYPQLAWTAPATEPFRCRRCAAANLVAERLK